MSQQQIKLGNAQVVPGDVKSIARLYVKAHKLGLKLCVRMNGSTDIGWEGVRLESGFTLFELWPDVEFVDYTKNPKRMFRFLEGDDWPINYHLTFSRSEENLDVCSSVLQAGGTVAAVFAGDKPSSYLGFPTVDGDKHDLIHTVPGGHVIALAPKGRKAKRDTSGFVVR
jgi:hypothetical protein